MKKVFTLIVAILLFSAYSQVQGQVIFTSGFETWSGSHHPAGWVGTKTTIDTTTGIIKSTTSPHGGSSSVQLVNTGSSHKRFTTTGVSVESGVFYEVSYWVNGSGNIRCGVTDLTAFSLYVPIGYHAISSATWTQYKDTVVGPGTNAAGEFVISVSSTVAPNHLLIDDVTITKLAISVPTVSIHDIQYSTATPADSPYAGDNVNTGGIVTAASSSFFVLQSHAGPWNGIEVYDNTHVVAVGDSVTLSGTVSEYNGLTEIGGVYNFTIVNSSNPLPGPEIIPVVLVNSEPYECVFMRLENVICTDTAVGYNQYKLFDGNDTCTADDILYHFDATPGAHYDVNGIGYYYFSKYEILPRSAADINISTFSVEENNTTEVKMYPNPVVNELNVVINGKADAIRITDMLGNIVYNEFTKGQSNIIINTRNFSAGSYVVSLLNEGVITARQVIVK